MEESLQKMTVQRADKAFFFTKDNCIDKTYELEKGIKMFPSIFIEGAAASGKTVAVKMFLEKQKDINFALFFMDKERDDGTFIRKLSQIRKRMEQETIWVICEDMNQPLSEIKATTLVEPQTFYCKKSYLQPLQETWSEEPDAGNYQGKGNGNFKITDKKTHTLVGGRARSERVKFIAV